MRKGGGCDGHHAPSILAVSATPAERVVLGGPLRFATGLVLFAIALALTGLGWRFGWGIVWMAWIPALFLLLPATALAGRTEIRRAERSIERHQGWLFRRILVLSVAGGELEILPAGGAWVVLLHRGAATVPLATWVSRATAERIASLCDRAHPAGAVPRRATLRPAGDR